MRKIWGKNREAGDEENIENEVLLSYIHFKHRSEGLVTITSIQSHAKVSHAHFDNCHVILRFVMSYTLLIVLFFRFLCFFIVHNLSDLFLWLNYENNLELKVNSHVFPLFHDFLVVHFQYFLIFYYSVHFNTIWTVLITVQHFCMDKILWTMDKLVDYAPNPTKVHNMIVIIPNAKTPT